MTAHAITAPAEAAAPIPQTKPDSERNHQPAIPTPSDSPRAVRPGECPSTNQPGVISNNLIFDHPQPLSSPQTASAKQTHHAPHTHPSHHPSSAATELCSRANEPASELQRLQSPHRRTDATSLPPHPITMAPSRRAAAALLRSAAVPRRSFQTSARLLETPAGALPQKKPVGAFRGTIFGFLAGSVTAGAGMYYYVMEEYKVANQLLSEDIYALQSAVQRIESYVRVMEDKVEKAVKK